MNNSHFYPTTQSILIPDTQSGELKFVSRAGDEVDSTAEDTLLFNESVSQDNLISKFKQTLLVTAHDPVNPIIELPCDQCKRKLVKFQRLGSQEKVYYVCLCGNIWSY